jgi:hypothetical protein
MAKSIRTRNPRDCEYCGKPVRQDSDHMRAQLRGNGALLHWPCFIALMRKNEPTQEQQRIS